MTDILRTKEITKLATLGIPKRTKKYNFISIAFSVGIFIRNESLEHNQ